MAAFYDERIPFGRYKGRSVRELPDADLKWAFAVADRPLLQAIIDELIERGITADEVKECWRRQQWTHQSRRQARPEGDNGGHAGHGYEIQGRKGGRLDGPVKQRAMEIIESGFRSLAKQHHPDVGGEPEAMREIIEAAEMLKRLIGP